MNRGEQRKGTFRSADICLEMDRSARSVWKIDTRQLIPRLRKKCSRVNNAFK